MFFFFFRFIFYLQLAPLQPPPAVANFNDAASDEINGIYSELADLMDILNDGDGFVRLGSTMSSNKNTAQQSLSELGAQNYVELNDIVYDQEEDLFPDFYAPVRSPEMDVDAIFFRGDAPS